MTIQSTWLQLLQHQQCPLCKANLESKPLKRDSYIYDHMDCQNCHLEALYEQNSHQWVAGSITWQCGSANYELWIHINLPEFTFRHQHGSNIMKLPQFDLAQYSASQLHDKLKLYLTFS